jgi:hypothetical protein
MLLDRGLDITSPGTPLDDLVDVAARRWVLGQTVDEDHAARTPVVP